MPHTLSLGVAFLRARGNTVCRTLWTADLGRFPGHDGHLNPGAFLHAIWTLTDLLGRPVRVVDGCSRSDERVSKRPVLAAMSYVCCTAATAVLVHDIVWT